MLLWELIKSLTKPELYKFKERAFEKERRYPKYVELFDLIYKQDEYDEEAILRKFKKEKFIRQLHRSKNYLYNRILEYIRDVHNGDESELNGILEKLKILYQKRLYHHLPIYIEKGKKIATQVEDFNAIQKLIEFEIGALKNNGGWIKYQEEVDDLIQQELEAWRQQSNYLEIQRTEQAFLKIWAMENQDREVLLVQTQSNPIISDSRQALSNRARVIQLQVLVVCSFFEGKFNDLIVYSDNLINIFLENAGLMEDKSMLDSLTSAILYSSNFRLRSGDFKGAVAKFDLLTSYAEADKRIPSIFIDVDTVFNLTFAFLKGDIAHGQKTLRKFVISEMDSRYEPDTKSSIHIAHLGAILHLSNDDPHEALPWILRNRNRNSTSIRPDLLMHSRLLFILCHWRLGNVEVVEREIRSAKTSWGRNKLMNEYYEFFLTVFKNLINGKRPQREIIESAHLILRENLDNPLWSDFENYFHFEKWLRSIQLGIPVFSLP